MTQILAFIAAHMGFLWSGARFRLVGSQVTTANGGDALVLAESSVLRLRFVRDRGQLFLDMQPMALTTDEWYSIDLVRRLFLGKPETSAVLDTSYAEFLRKNLDAVEDRFKSEAWFATRGDLKGLKVRRAKEMFG